MANPYTSVLTTLFFGLKVQRCVPSKAFQPWGPQYHTDYVAMCVLPILAALRLWGHKCSVLHRVDEHGLVLRSCPVNRALSTMLHVCHKALSPVAMYMPHCVDCCQQCLAHLCDIMPTMKQDVAPAVCTWLGVRNVTLRGCALIVEGKGSWIMLLVVPPAHTNIPLATANQCFLF